MRKIEFLDTSLRDGEQTPGVNFSIKEKVAIAKQLEKWGISAIEAGFPAASPDSFEAVKQIAETLTKTSVTGLARRSFLWRAYCTGHGQHENHGGQSGRFDGSSAGAIGRS